MSGVKYSTSCPGGLNDVASSQEVMQTWYNKMKKKGEIEIPLKEFYITTGRKANLIIAKTAIPTDSLYVFIANPNGVGTTQFKKKINHGKLGDPIDINIKVKANPYIYERVW